MQTSFTISARESVRLSDLNIFDAVLSFERLSVDPALQYDTEKILTNITEVFTLDENDAAMIVRYQHTRSGQYLLTLDCGVGTLSRRALSVVAATPSALTSFLGISARCGPGHVQKTNSSIGTPAALAILAPQRVKPKVTPHGWFDTQKTPQHKTAIISVATSRVRLI